MEPIDIRRRRGRGALSNRPGRYEPAAREAFDDGWASLEHVLDAAPPRTRVQPEHPKRIVSRNASPDIGFDRSINPYQGCEHGCVYCYARPTHAYQGLSPGLDFETRIFSKPTAPALLRKELSSRRYDPATIVIGANTDPYQPAERRLGITRGLLEVMAEFRHPVGLITKSRGVLRDLDLLADLARDGLARVAISVTTLRTELSRSLEPRASAPAGRLAAIRALAAAGVPVIVMVAPIIPAVNDAEIERILEAAADAGAQSAGTVLLRLPREVADLFQEWLDGHVPDRAAKVLSLLRQSRDGELYRSQFGTRMRGTGPYAELIARRVELAKRRYGLDRPPTPLRTDRFVVPPQPGDQLGLFSFPGRP